LNLLPDIYTFGDKNLLAASEGFGDYDAEILLMGRQDEGLTGVQRSPFLGAFEHSWPMDPVTDTKLVRETNEIRFPAGIVWAGQYEIVWKRRAHPTERFNE